MPDDFDPYREALVVEHTTHWPAEIRQRVADWSAGKREAFAAQLHAAPDQATGLEYVRVHTGFCRRIIVTAFDLDRLA
ncbi:hypothetical protein [Botrimarina hoheduenensis]|uniref:Uncharacterized protein n=1 Tax=Botrimarina hoheduenensis TaxID=2528000 RepID=A0A5C5W936_9BACT|nr:hypothetical protein [Botrimarina hoheduenensis]TWT46539.1 hypothetical protein Pla111_16350 [Botrimarina hoheduenensis]